MLDGYRGKKGFEKVSSGDHDDDDDEDFGADDFGELGREHNDDYDDDDDDDEQGEEVDFVAQRENRRKSVASGRSGGRERRVGRSDTESDPLHASKPFFWIRMVVVIGLIFLCFYGGLKIGENMTGGLARHDENSSGSSNEQTTHNSGPTGSNVGDTPTFKPRTPPPSFAPTKSPTTLPPSLIPEEDAGTPAPSSVPHEEDTPAPSSAPHAENIPAPTGPTQKPTEAPTSGPTISFPTLEFDNVLVDMDTIADPWEIANIPEERIKFWQHEYIPFGDEIGNHIDKIHDAKRAKDKNETSKQTEATIKFHNETCQALTKKEERKFGKDLPYTDVEGKSHEPNSERLSFNIDHMKRRAKSYIRYLCKYYKPTNDEGKHCDLSLAVRPRHPSLKELEDYTKDEENAFKRWMNLLAWKFAHNMIYKKNMVVAVMGTSVLAGHDNCFDATYAPVLEREFSKLLEGSGIKAEVRNAAQNGDGASQYQAMMCFDAIFKIDEVDFLHTFWSMTDNPSLLLDEMIVRKYMEKLILPFYLDGLDPFRKPSKRSRPRIPVRYWGSGLTQTRGKIVPKKNLNPWWRSPKILSHWGRHGDGRCHLKTREGFDGVHMQNWHPGPLGNEIMVHHVMFQYAQAMLVALDQMSLAVDKKRDLEATWRQKPKIELPPFVNPMCDEKAQDCPVRFFGWPVECYTGHQGSWNGPHNISEMLVPDEENPFDELKVPNGTEWGWEYVLLKHSSGVAHALDINKAELKHIPACNGHLDSGYGYRAKTENSWITFKMPAKLKKGALFMCSTKDYKDWIKNSKPFQVRLDNKPIQFPLEAVPHSKTQCIHLTNTTAPTDKEFYISILGQEKLHLTTIFGF